MLCGLADEFGKYLLLPQGKFIQPLETLYRQIGFRVGGSRDHPDVAIVDSLPGQVKPDSFTMGSDYFFPSMKIPYG